ncbi:signal peptidase I [bacterium]|nr:signal peptidase I [bacterium]
MTEPRTKLDPLFALILSFLLPGAGQLYNGQAWKALFFFTVTCCAPLGLLFQGLGYTLPGMIILLVGTFLIWLIVLLDAFFTARKRTPGLSWIQRRWFVILPIVVGAVVLYGPLTRNVQCNFLAAYKIPSDSMSPTLRDGDHIAVRMKCYNHLQPQWGDLIVFKEEGDSNRQLIKRLTGLPGDRIEIRDKQLYRNGKAISEPWTQYLDDRILPGELSPRDNYGPVEVPESSLFVLGDNRDNSLDSRQTGFVPMQAVQGKALYIYWARVKSRIGQHF